MLIRAIITTLTNTFFCMYANQMYILEMNQVNTVVVSAASTITTVISIVAIVSVIPLLLKYFINISQSNDLLQMSQATESSSASSCRDPEVLLWIVITLLACCEYGKQPVRWWRTSSPFSLLSKSYI